MVGKRYRGIPTEVGSAACRPVESCVAVPLEAVQNSPLKRKDQRGHHPCRQLHSKISNHHGGHQASSFRLSSVSQVSSLDFLGIRSSRCERPIAPHVLQGPIIQDANGTCNIGMPYRRAVSMRPSDCRSLPPHPTANFRARVGE